MGCILPLISKSSGRKRSSAAATAGGVRVFECESGAHHVRGVIDRDTAQILSREHIDEKPDPVLFDKEITLPRVFLDVKAVLETGTTARNDTDAKPCSFGKVLFRNHKLPYLNRRRFGNIQLNRGCCNC